jgi:hypothetical protein
VYVFYQYHHESIKSHMPKRVKNEFFSKNKCRKNLKNCCLKGKRNMDKRY